MEGNGKAATVAEAPKKASVSLEPGKRFSLTKLERLDTTARLAHFELEAEKIVDARTQYLHGMGRKVLERVGAPLDKGGRIYLGFHIDGGTLTEIEVLPEPAPAAATPDGIVPAAPTA